jgi:hypothetical protein
MVPLTALWLPILLAAVIVFVASAIMHMVLPYHRSDYQKLPDEDKLLAALRAAGLKRGLYVFPYCTQQKEMKSPSMIEKYKQGPVGMLTEKWLEKRKNVLASGGHKERLYMSHKFRR